MSVSLAECLRKIEEGVEGIRQVLAFLTPGSGCPPVLPCVAVEADRPVTPAATKAVAPSCGKSGGGMSKALQKEMNRKGYVSKGQFLRACGRTVSGGNCAMVDRVVIQLKVKVISCGGGHWFLRADADAMAPELK